MQKGIFIVIEGTDGSGKGTIITMLNEWLLKKGHSKGKILLTQEPSKSAYGKKIRQILKNEVDPGKDPKLLLGLYLKDRAEHLKKEILPALKEGKTVLCDRYKYSTVAYQAAQGLDIKELASMNRKFLSPDVCLILDLPPSQALSRIEGDEERGEKELFERKEFLQKVRDNFLMMKGLFPDERIVVIDAYGSKETVFSNLINELKILLKSQKQQL